MDLAMRPPARQGEAPLPSPVPAPALPPSRDGAARAVGFSKALADPGALAAALREGQLPARAAGLLRLLEDPALVEAARASAEGAMGRGAALRAAIPELDRRHPEAMASLRAEVAQARGGQGAHSSVVVIVVTVVGGSGGSAATDHLRELAAALAGEPSAGAGPRP